MTTLETLELENAKLRIQCAELQRKHDELLRTHILHQLVAMEMSGIRPKFRELH